MICFPKGRVGEVCIAVVQRAFTSSRYVNMLVIFWLNLFHAGPVESEGWLSVGVLQTIDNIIQFTHSVSFFCWLWNVNYSQNNRAVLSREVEESYSSNSELLK